MQAGESASSTPPKSANSSGNSGTGTGSDTGSGSGTNNGATAAGIGSDSGSGSPLTKSCVSSKQENVNELRLAHGLLILCRHGESMWNRRQDAPDALWRYAGSTDVALSMAGVKEAMTAGDAMRNIPVDIVFSSNLSRAMNTAMIALCNHSSKRTPIVVDREGNYECAMKAMDKLPDGAVTPIVCSNALNERNFGELQGMPSTDHQIKFTKEFLVKVRNDYRTRFPGPGGESTEDVYNRIVPYFESTIKPLLMQGKNVLLSSHGFAIRALIKFLDQMEVEEFNSEMIKEKRDPENCKLLAATGCPLVYRFDHLSDSGLPEKLGAIDREFELKHTCSPY